MRVELEGDLGEEEKWERHPEDSNADSEVSHFPVVVVIAGQRVVLTEEMRPIVKRLA